MENCNSLINNVELKNFDFKNINDITNYMYKTKTSQSSYFSSTVSKHFKVVGEKNVYYYNSKTKLYTSVDKAQFEGYIYSFFDNTSKLIKRILKDTDDLNDAIEKSIKDLCKEFDKESYISTIIKRSYTNLYNGDLISQLNSQSHIFPIKGGKKINFKTLEVSERTKDDFFDYESPVDYLADSELKNAEKFFSQVMTNPVNKKFMQRVLGYSITGETMARKFFIWYGHGANAKSLIFTLLNLILRNQYTQCDKSVFIKTKSSKGATPEIMDLMGQRVGVYSEGETAEKIELNLSLLKSLSGEDLIKGRHLYGNLIEFRAYAKLHMLTNFKPPLNAEEAIKDRLVYMFLDSRFCKNPVNKNEFKIDTEFVKKLQNEHLSEIFTWIAKGAHEFYKTQDITMPLEFEKRTEHLLSEQDSIASFVSRKLEITKDKADYCRKNDLFDSYKIFCNDNSQRCQPRSSLWQRMDQLMSKGIKSSTLNGYDVYRCVKIKDNIDEAKESDLDNGVENTCEELTNLQTKVKEQEDEIAKLKRMIDEMKSAKKEEIKEPEADNKLSFKNLDELANHNMKKHKTINAFDDGIDESNIIKCEQGELPDVKDDDLKYCSSDDIEFVEEEKPKKIIRRTKRLSKSKKEPVICETGGLESLDDYDI